MKALQLVLKKNLINKIKTLATKGQKIKHKLLIIFVSIILGSCSNSTQSNGVEWSGPLNFMHVTKEKMEMIYSVDVTGQKVFLDGFYEVTKKNTDEVLFRLKVEELELGNREDGRSFCRVWGNIDESNIQSYLFALDCKQI